MYATSKASFQDFLDFKKYLNKATDEEKDDYAKAVLGEAQGKVGLNSLQRLKEAYEDAQQQQQVVVSKKSMLTTFADEDTHAQVKEAKPSSIHEEVGDHIYEGRVTCKRT